MTNKSNFCSSQHPHPTYRKTQRSMESTQKKKQRHVTISILSVIKQTDRDSGETEGEANSRVITWRCKAGV